jgi:hypothetical protein
MPVAVVGNNVQLRQPWPGYTEKTITTWLYIVKIMFDHFHSARVSIEGWRTGKC